MRLVKPLTFAIALVLLVGCGSHSQEQGKAEKLTSENIPPKIMAAINGRFPGAQVTSAERENEDGKIVYDIELKHSGRKYEMDIHDDGTIIEIEKEMDASKLPEAAAKTLADKYPGSSIKEVMEVNKVSGTKETPDHYEVVIETAQKKSQEVILSLDGKSSKAEPEEKK